MPGVVLQALTRLFFSIISSDMAIRKWMVCICLAALLAGCAPPAPTPDVAPTYTPSPSLLPGVSPSPTLLPSQTATPTPTPEARIINADLALFNGDYSLAQTEYQAAFASSTDRAIQAAALWSLGLTDMRAGNFSKALVDFSRLIADYSRVSPSRPGPFFAW